MLTRLRLENFKSWRVLDIELAPITLLFGTNSSGKSSVLQALLLLKQTLLSYDHTQELNLGGGRTDYVDFGSYADLIYRHDEGQLLTLSLTFESSVGSPLVYRAAWKLSDEIRRMDAFEPEPKSRSRQDWCRVELEAALDRMAYLAPLRADARRVYQLRGTAARLVSRRGENMIDVLLAAERTETETLSAVAEALVQLGLAEAFELRKLDPEGRYYEPRLIINDQEVALADVGSGVAQVLPVITLLFTAPEGTTLLLEHPDLHLHPSAQAALADIMLQAAEMRKLQLIVESHSEHLLTRLQRRIAEGVPDFATPQNIRAYFCQPSPEGSRIQAVEVNEYGQILNYPPNFFGDLAGDLTAATRAGLHKRRQELERASRGKADDER